VRNLRQKGRRKKKTPQLFAHIALTLGTLRGHLDVILSRKITQTTGRQAQGNAMYVPLLRRVISMQYFNCLIANKITDDLHPAVHHP